MCGMKLVAGCRLLVVFSLAKNAKDAKSGNLNQFLVVFFLAFLSVLCERVSCQFHNYFQEPATSNREPTTHSGSRKISVFFKENFELACVEVSQYESVDFNYGNEALAAEFDGFLTRGGVLAGIADGVLPSSGIEPFLGVNAPAAHGARIQDDFLRLLEDLHGRPGSRGLCRGLSKTRVGIRSLRLHVWHRGSIGLFERNRRAGNQGSHEEIGQGQDHIQILAHVAMMKEVMAIEAEKDSRAFHIAGAGHVHAEVKILIHRVVDHHGPEGAPNDRVADQILDKKHERHVKGPHDRGIPPGHGDGPEILHILDVIGMVGFEDAVMGHRVGLEGVGEPLQVSVHDVLVKGPLKEA